MSLNSLTWKKAGLQLLLESGYYQKKHFSSLKMRLLLESGFNQRAVINEASAVFRNKTIDVCILYRKIKFSKKLFHIVYYLVFPLTLGQKSNQKLVILPQTQVIVPRCFILLNGWIFIPNQYTCKLQCKNCSVLQQCTFIFFI